MKITSKGRYALIIMIEIAMCYQEGHVSLRSLSENQQISLKFSEQIVRGLCKAGLLTSVRGSRGGYMLVKPPSRYTVGEILRTTEDSLVPSVELSVSPWQKPSAYDSVAISFFRGLHEAINRYADSVTLEDLTERYREQSANDYVI